VPVESAPGIDALLGLRTMHLGPDQLIVAARVAFDDEISADRPRTWPMRSTGGSQAASSSRPRPACGPSR
jgi:hypothetical protein